MFFMSVALEMPQLRCGDTQPKFQPFRLLSYHQGTLRKYLPIELQVQQGTWLKPTNLQSRKHIRIFEGVSFDTRFP